MSAPGAEDRRWLDAAARQAAVFLGTTGGRPTVGAIVVDPVAQRLLGRAVTPAGGRGFAEVQALEEAGAAASGATLYLTLEPAAADVGLEAILAAGIARVVLGLAEPDPQRAAQGTARLRAAGLEVVVGDQPSARRLHEGHVSRKTRGRPFVSAKLAVSADGKVGPGGQGGAQLVGDTARRWAGMQRAMTDAVLVGWGTARADDPLLAVELDGLQSRTPLPVIVAGHKTHNPRMRLLTEAADRPVMVIGIPEKQLALPPNVEILRVKGTRGRPDLRLALAALADRGVQSALVETGPTLLEALLQAGLIDRFHLLLGDSEVGPNGLAATAHGSIEARLVAAGLSLVDHRLLGADNLRTFERSS